MVAQIRHDLLAQQPADDLRAAEHRAAHRLRGEGALLEMVEDDVVRGVVGLADLLQNDRALAFELGRVKARMHQDIGQDVEGERHILLQHLGVISRALARGVGVQVAADRLDLLGDRAGAAPLGALERHVLEEMRDAVDLGRLMASADLDPDAERDGIDRLDAIGDDAQAIGELSERYGHAAPQLGCARREWARTKRATAPASLGRTVTRSRRSMMSASAGGNAGRVPVARATASGNLAGCALASAIIAVDLVSSSMFMPPISTRAAAIATAVCGSISIPERAWTSAIVFKVSASSTR